MTHPEDTATLTGTRASGVTMGTTPHRARELQPSPHLPQLLARGLVLSSLTQVLHTLMLGQEVLLLGIHFVTLPLVEQFAEGDAELVKLGGALGNLCLPRLLSLHSYGDLLWRTGGSLTACEHLGFNGKSTGAVCRRWPELGLNEQ